MLNKEIMPVKGLKAAAVYAMIFTILLTVTGHPVEELAVTAATLYLLSCIAAEIIARITLHFLAGIARYAERISMRLGARNPDSRPSGHEPFVRATARIVAGLLFCSIICATLLTGAFTVSAAGLSPLPSTLLWIAAAIFLTGTTGLTAIFSLTTLAVFTVAQLPESVNPKFDHLHNLTRDAGVRLRTVNPNSRPA